MRNYRRSPETPCDRHDDDHITTICRWARCQAQWAGLYAALEACGEWLDGAERALETAHAAPYDARRTLRDLDKQMAVCQRQVGVSFPSPAECNRRRGLGRSMRVVQVSSWRSAGRAVVGACSAPLSRDVQEQLDSLNERWHGVARALQLLRDRPSNAGPPASPGPPAPPSTASSALRHVRDLLDTTSANPSDATSLSIRLSLVKVNTHLRSTCHRSSPRCRRVSVHENGYKYGVCQKKHFKESGFVSLQYNVCIIILIQFSVIGVPECDGTYAN